MKKPFNVFLIIALFSMSLSGCSSDQKVETSVTDAVLLYYGSTMSDAAGFGYAAEDMAAVYGLPKEIFPVKPFDGMNSKVRGVIVHTEDEYSEPEPDIITYDENGFKKKAEYTDKYDRYEYEFGLKWTDDGKLVEESILLSGDAEGGYAAVYTIDGILDRSSEVKFDGNGKPIQRNIYWHTDYREDENRVEYLVPAKKPKLHSEETWKYDTDGNIIEYTISLWGRKPDIWTMTYSEGGASLLSVMRVFSDGKEEKIEYKYYEGAPEKPAEITFYDQDGRRQKRHWLSYDAGWNLSEVIIEEDGRFSSRTFAPDGMCLTYSSPNHNGTTSYEYDKSGNWTKEISHSDFGTSTRERQITYY